MVQDIVLVFGVVVIGMVPTMWLASKTSNREAKWIWLGYIVHVLTAWLHLWAVNRFYQGGDASYYYWMGDQIRLLVLDHPKYFSEVLRLSANLEATFPFPVRGNGNTTGAMSGLAALLLIFTGGSQYATGTLVSIVAFYALIFLFLTFRLFRSSTLGIAMATLFMPSSTFWGSGLTKETAAVAGLCVGLGSLAHWYQGKLKLIWALPLGVFGFFVVYVFKPYILVAVLGALGLASIKKGKGTVNRMAIRLAISVVVLLIVTTLAPEYSPTTVVEQFGEYQQLYPEIQAGSNFEYSQSGDTSFVGQLRNVPLAFVSSFFRPFIFEAHNFAAALGALETTVFLVLFVKILFRDSFKQIWRRITGDQLLLFSLGFAIILGIAVGLSAPNLGTLSRYRMPMMPFWGLLLVSLAYRPKLTQRRRVA